MPAERVAMRKVREILRLKLGVGLSHKAIARSLGIVPSTVRLTLERAGAAGFSWPLPDDATDAILEETLYGRAGTKQGYRHRAEPEWAVIHGRAPTVTCPTLRGSGTSTIRRSRTSGGAFRR